MLIYLTNQEDQRFLHEPRIPKIAGLSTDKILPKSAMQISAPNKLPGV